MKLIDSRSSRFGDNWPEGEGLLWGAWAVKAVVELDFKTKLRTPDPAKKIRGMIQFGFPRA
jgi:hypothetical protein